MKNIHYLRHKYNVIYIAKYSIVKSTAINTTFISKTKKIFLIVGKTDGRNQNNTLNQFAMKTFHFERAIDT